MGIFCKLCCKCSRTTCVFLFSLALHLLMWSVIKNTENPLPGLLHQQMLIRATHNQSSSSPKWSFHLSSKCTWACFTILTSHLFQWVWRLSHRPQDDTGHDNMEPIRIRANGLKKIKLAESNLISKCHKGAQLYSEISKIMNSDTGARVQTYVSRKRNNFPMNNLPQQVFSPYRRSRTRAVHSTLNNTQKTKNQGKRS